MQRRLESSLVARLGTVSATGRPHLVPVTFALVRTASLAAGFEIVTAVDHKPKRTTSLVRLANIERDRRVSLLVDHYDADDWSALWWARVDGEARVVAAGDVAGEPGRAALEARYAQYAERPPTGPLIVIRPAVARTWSATTPDP